MILAIDVGNTNIVMGCIEDGEIRMTARIATNRLKTGDEYTLILHELLKMRGIDGSALEGGIVSSVVPGLSQAMRHAVENVTGKSPLMVGPGQLGGDLVVDAVAACHQYEAPIAIFDMGTATTMSIIDQQKRYIGGMIIPGASLSLEALASRTSQLPHVGVEAPRSLIGTNTVDCMRSGIVYSTAAMIDGLIQRVNEELSKPVTAVATGGLAEMFVPYCKEKVIYNRNLLLDGLWILYCKNRKEKR